MRCTPSVLIVVKKAEEQFREAVEEERGFVDLFGNSSQSQMSDYSPQSPPPRRKKGGVPRIGDAWKRVGTGWTMMAAEGTGGGNCGEGKRRTKEDDNDCGGNRGERKRGAND